nr:TetR family transcriptional regulator [Deltaproteobacteria bacterium]
HQDRSRDTQARIVDAARRMLEKGQSFHEISVAALAREADASVGAFYNRFRDKDALLHVLQIELCREGEATAAAVLVPERWKGVPIEPLIRAFVGLAVASYRQQAGLRRALLVAMCNDKQFRDRSAALTKLTCEGLTQVLAARSPRTRRSEIRLAVDVCHRMVYGVLDQDLLFADDPPTGHALTDKQLAAELCDACLAYLAPRAL